MAVDDLIKIALYCAYAHYSCRLRLVNSPFITGSDGVILRETINNERRLSAMMANALPFVSIRIKMPLQGLQEIRSAYH
jgi:hypothetical protein